jgi:hypothetical protein
MFAEEKSYRHRTHDPKEHPRLANATGGFVPIVEHLQHRTHLLATVLGLVLDNKQLVLGRAVDLDYTVTRVGCVRGNNIEAQLILIQNKLVES